jgi:NAD(P)-dependent dehydrogenase (short-subunit alcohol dehydrogenase family)
LKCFDLTGKVAAITGGGGDLCGAMAEALGLMGVKVALLDIDLKKAEARSSAVTRSRGTAKAFRCDVLGKGQVQECYEAVCSLWGPEDLIGTLVWLLSDASSFVTGVVAPVEGGYSSYSI